MPQAISTLFLMVAIMMFWNGCRDALQYVFLYGLLYPLVVPAMSIYYSAKLLLGGKDEDDWLTTIKDEEMLTGLKAFKVWEHFGPYFLFNIL